MTAVCYDPKDVCYFHPCQNGGTCSPPKANDGDKPYTCHCFLGFGGVSCEKRQGKSADWVLYEYSSGSLRWSISGGMFYVGTWLQKMQQKWFRVEKVFVQKNTNGSTFGLLWCGTLVRTEQGSCFHFAYLFFVVFVPNIGPCAFTNFGNCEVQWCSSDPPQGFKYFVGHTTSRLQSELGATRTVNFPRSKYFFQFRHHVLQFTGMTFSQSSVN